MVGVCMFMCMSQVFHNKMFEGRGRQSLVNCTMYRGNLVSFRKIRSHVTYWCFFRGSKKSQFLLDHVILYGWQQIPFFITFWPKENVYAAGNFQCIIFFKVYTVMILNGFTSEFSTSASLTWAR